MTLLCEWVKGVSNAGACAELNITPSTVTKWYKKFSLLVYNFYYSSDSEVQIGGEGCIVELDEALLVKRKYSRGRILRNQVWAVGGVVRGAPPSLYIEKVESRNRRTLIEIIRRKIARGSEIHTDSWRGYNGLNLICDDLNFSHKTVNHSVSFVNH